MLQLEKNSQSSTEEDNEDEQEMQVEDNDAQSSDEKPSIGEPKKKTGSIRQIYRLEKLLEVQYGGIMYYIE